MSPLIQDRCHPQIQPHAGPQRQAFDYGKSVLMLDLFGSM